MCRSSKGQLFTVQTLLSWRIAKYSIVGAVQWQSFRLGGHACAVTAPIRHALVKVYYRTSDRNYIIMYRKYIFTATPCTRVAFHASTSKVITNTSLVRSTSF